MRNAGDSGKGQNRAATVRERGSAFVAKSIQENVSALRCHALRCHAPCMNQPVRIEQWLGTWSLRGWKPLTVRSWL